MKPENNQHFNTFKATLITLSDEENIIIKKAFISQLTSQGFDLIVHYRDLVPTFLKSQLNLDYLLNKKLSLYIPLMEIDLEVTVISARHVGKGDFKIKTEFFIEIPQYWRECLCELWPATLPLQRVKTIQQNSRLRLWDK